MRLKLIEDGTQSARSVEMTEDEAVALLETGNAVLDVAQPTPPFALLDLLAKRLETHSAFGPSTADPKTRSKLVSQAFINGIRQDYLDGHELIWHRSGKDFMKAIGFRLSQFAAGQQDPFEQAKYVIDHSIEMNAKEIEYGQALRPEQISSQKLVERTKDLNNVLLDRYVYYRVPSLWYEYHQDLQVLERARDSIVRQGIADGSILAAETVDGRDHLMSGHRAKGKPFQSRKLNCWFCFSSCIPMSWFPDNTQKHLERAKASAWMAKTLRHFLAQGRRATAKDLQKAAVEKFGIAPDAANRAWSSIKQEFGLKLGRVTGEETVKLSEIMEID